MAVSKAVGIDLGTTYSSVAIMRPEGRPSTIINREGETLTPSVVLFAEDDQVLVGSTARRAAATMPADCAQFVKRHMGDPHWRFIDSRGREYRAEEVSALVLRRLAEDAELALGEPIRDVVITVPAYFDDARRKATLDAGEIAGLRVLRLINEPTAAAIAYGLDTLASGNVFVYDLGGGTFDVTVMRVRGGEFEVIATDGDRNLGGFDFDNALMRYVADQVIEQGGPDLHDVLVLEADLRDKCELAKRQLTTVDQASIFITAADQNFRIQVTRAQFEEMTRPLLDRTEVTATGVLDDAGLTWSDIDHVLLVGGSTRMRMVREMIQRISGKQPVTGINPDESVALGAAVVAEATAAEAAESTGAATALSRIAVRDVTSQSLGIIAVDKEVRQNTIVIPRNTRIPAKHERTYYTVEYDQRAVEVEVTEGDDEDLAYVTVLGSRPIPLTPGLPRNAPLKVTMSYDIDGVIHVELFDVTNRTPLGEFELDRPYNLDRAEVEKARTELATREVQ
ncbi:MAG TPA: Hsp70 family protein [Natronosporangium sp.]